jgi:hypothetical protein
MSIICIYIFIYMCIYKCSFFGAVRRIGAENYIPDETDVLRARTKTTGIMETRFNINQLSIQ